MVNANSVVRRLQEFGQNRKIIYTYLKVHHLNNPFYENWEIKITANPNHDWYYFI